MQPMSRDEGRRSRDCEEVGVGVITAAEGENTSVNGKGECSYRAGWTVGFVRTALQRGEVAPREHSLSR